jgi:hypothetical protein
MFRLPHRCCPSERSAVPTSGISRVQHKGGRYSITTFCNNVTNHFYATDIEDFWSGPWNANAVVLQPARAAVRYFGVRLTAGL